jgi:hypothetical protein
MYRRIEEAPPSTCSHDTSTEDTESTEDRSIASEQDLEVVEKPKIENETPKVKV